MNFGERIAQRRKALDMTQKYVAAMAGISVPFLSDLENGKRDTTTAVLLRIAKALECSAGDLLKTNDQGKRMRLSGSLTINGETYRIDDLDEDQPLVTVDFRNAHDLHLSADQKRAIGEAAERALSRILRSPVEGEVTA